MSEKLKFVGPEWGRAMRSVRGEDGKPCEVEGCGKPATQVAMVGIPSPAGLSYMGQIRLCDECAEKILAGELPTPLEQIEKKEEQA